jgi:hypothetical protein
MKDGGSRGGRAEAWNKGQTKHTNATLEAQSRRMSGAGNTFYGRKHTQETLDKISLSKVLESTSLEERLSRRQDEFDLVSSLDEYRSRQRQYLEFRCKKCGVVQPKTLQAFERGSRCYSCEPIGKSNWELEVYEFVKSLSPDAVTGDKRMIAPKELDVYVPSRKFAIECHGLYWHSEAARPDEIYDRNKHLKKYQLCNERGIKLLQLFEDEWRDKRSICEDMIRHRLGLNANRCKTWSTKIVQLSVAEQREFFNSTHIAGFTPSKVCWGLRDRQGKTVAALSLRAPRQFKKYAGSLEIARFSTALGMSVPGGLSKLLRAARDWCLSCGVEIIMTYVDRRIGSGAGYTASGMRNVGNTAPDYWYTDNSCRYDRFKFRARHGKSENQVALEARVSRIWGCGSETFVLNLSEKFTL